MCVVEIMQKVTVGVEQGGDSICQAAEKCDIPHSLHDYVSGKIEHDRS